MNIRFLVPALVLALLTSCQAAAVMGTPEEVKSIPVMQAVMLESAMDSINENDAALVNADGSVKRAEILAVLQADKEAWDQLDRYYNEQATAQVVPVPPSPIVEDDNLAAVTPTRYSTPRLRYSCGVWSLNGVEIASVKVTEVAAR